MKKVLLIVSVLMAFAFTNRDSAYKSTLVSLTPESSLLVRGTTNVNTFTCAFNINKFKNPILVSYKIENTKMTFNKTALVLETNCFDCGGKAINNDFQSILKADKYPHITLFLKEISNFDANDVHAQIDIQIAGITNNYKVPVKLKKSSSILVTGNLSLSLADFSIHPPKKFLGLISVNDKIDIYFQLVVKEN